MNDFEPQPLAVEEAENAAAAFGAEIEGEEFFGEGHGDCVFGRRAVFKG